MLKSLFHGAKTSICWKQGENDNEINILLCNPLSSVDFMDQDIQISLNVNIDL